MTQEIDRDKIEYRYRTSISQSVDGVCMVEVSVKSDDPKHSTLDTATLFDGMVKVLKDAGYPVAGTPEAAELRGKKKP